MALADNLISYWKLDEASGNALDAHGANTLTENNTVGSATGKISNARDFTADFVDGFFDYFSLADNSDLSANDTDFTFQAWCYLDDTSNLHTVLSKWGTTNGAREYLLRYSNSLSRFQFAVRSASATGVATANTFGAPSTGTWYLLHGWHDSVNNLVGISVNAGTADTTAHSTGVQDTTNAFAIGAGNGNTEGWDGLIDEVAFWRRVLTSDERTDLYNSGSGRDYSYITGGGGGGTSDRPLQFNQSIQRASRW